MSLAAREEERSLTLESVLNSLYCVVDSRPSHSSGVVLTGERVLIKGAVLLAAVVAWSGAYAEERRRPPMPAVCDGPICLTDVRWFNQVRDHRLVGQNIDAVLVNKSNARLDDVTVTFYVVMPDGRRDGIPINLPGTVSARTSRLFGVRLSTRSGVQTDFATLQGTVTQPDGSSGPVSAEFHFLPVWNPFAGRVQGEATHRAR